MGSLLCVFSGSLICMVWSVQDKICSILEGQWLSYFPVSVDNLWPPFVVAVWFSPKCPLGIAGTEGVGYFWYDIQMCLGQRCISFCLLAEWWCFDLCTRTLSHHFLYGEVGRTYLRIGKKLILWCWFVLLLTLLIFLLPMSDSWWW